MPIPPIYQTFSEKILWIIANNGPQLHSKIVQLAEELPQFRRKSTRTFYKAYQFLLQNGWIKKVPIEPRSYLGYQITGKGLVYLKSLKEDIKLIENYNSTIELTPEPSKITEKVEDNVVEIPADIEIQESNITLDVPEESEKTTQAPKEEVKIETDPRVSLSQKSVEELIDLLNDEKADQPLILQILLQDHRLQGKDLFDRVMTQLNAEMWSVLLGKLALSVEDLFELAETHMADSNKTVPQYLLHILLGRELEEDQKIRLLEDSFTLDKTTDILARLNLTLPYLLEAAAITEEKTLKWALLDTSIQKIISEEHFEWEDDVQLKNRMARRIDIVHDYITFCFGEEQLDKVYQLLQNLLQQHLIPYEYFLLLLRICVNVKLFSMFEQRLDAFAMEFFIESHVKIQIPPRKQLHDILLFEDIPENARDIFEPLQSLLAQVIYEQHSTKEIREMKLPRKWGMMADLENFAQLGVLADIPLGPYLELASATYRALKKDQATIDDVAFFESNWAKEEELNSLTPVFCKWVYVAKSPTKAIQILKDWVDRTPFLPQVDLTYEKNLQLLCEWDTDQKETWQHKLDILTEMIKNGQLAINSIKVNS